MSVFAVIHQSDKDPENLDECLMQNYKGNVLRLTDTAWLIAAKGTATGISEKIGFGNKDGPGSGIVFAIGAYFGFTQKNVWEWISQKWEESENG